MRKNRARVIPAILILLVLLFTSACGGSNTPAAQSTQSTSAATAAVTSESTAQTIDPLGKYDPAIDMTTVNVRLNPNDTLPEGQSAEKNVWTDAYLEKLGINVKTLWSVPSTQAQDKMRGGYSVKRPA